MPATLSPALERVLFSGPPVMLRDRFNRGDSATSIGAAETGQAWANTTGTWGISGGAAYSASDANGDLALVDCGLVDGVFQADITADFSTWRLPSLMFRATDANNWLRVYLFNGNIFLGYISGGSGSDLANVAMTTTNGQTYRVRVEAFGTAVRVYVDGVLKITFTLSSSAAALAGTKTGIRISKNNAPTFAARLDNLTVRRA